MIMSRKYFFSVIGAYNEDSTIFDGLRLPDKIVTEGYEDLFQEMPVMNKEVFIRNLLCELGELSLKHTNIEFLKFEITAWSDKNYYNWCQLYETTFYKYNPLWNYLMKRNENTKDDLKNNKQGANSTTTSDVTTDNLKENIISNNTMTDDLTERTIRDGTDNNETINKVAGFDAVNPTIHDTNEYSDTWEDDATKTNTGTKKTNTESEKKNTGTKTRGITTDGTNSESGSENRTINLVYDARGSLGTSNLASAIAAQRRIIINMYDYIIDAFKQRFCLMIY